MIERFPAIGFRPSQKPATIVAAVALALMPCGCADPEPGEKEGAPPSDERAPAMGAKTATIDPALAAEGEPLITQIAPGASRSDYIGPLRDAYDRIDPIKDGWESEALSSAALDQLHHLEPLLLSPEAAGEEALAAIVTPGVASDPLRPENLEEIFNDGQLSVARLGDPALGGPTPVRGATAFLDQLKRLGEGNTPESTRLKMKIYRIEQLAATSTETEILVTMHRSTGSGRKQINAKWRCRWHTPEGAAPRLERLHVTQYEEVIQPGSSTPLFEDGTASVLGANDSYSGQFLVQTDQWRARLPRDLGLDAVANHGLAVGDVNGDDLDDLYVCQQGGLPNRLFVQQPDGTLQDVSEGSGTDWLDYCSGALMVDLDNDGDRDLIVSQDLRMLVLSNDGSGIFTLEFGSSTKAQSFSVAAADYDNDGLVDFYICGYNPSASAMRSGAMGEPIPFHDANNGGSSMLWRNAGNFIFEDVTADTGIDQNNTRFSFAAAWEDYDNDGDQDLYVANDYGRNCLYRNDGGIFSEVAPEMRVEDTSSGMSVSWSDFNNDGLMDLYTSNMFSSAGNRITYQRQFKPGVPEEIRRQFQHIAQGNTLFQAVPGGAPFEDVGAAASVQMGRWAWGSRFVDFNNDGLDDILVANGFISTEDTDDL